MKKFVFSVASRATGRLQIKPSGSGDENALHLENVRQLFQVLRVIQYQEFIVIYRSHPLTVRIVKR